MSNRNVCLQRRVRHARQQARVVNESGRIEPEALMLEGARVLIVDDDVEQRGLWGALLECMGHVPVRAESGDEALHLLDRETFDLAIATVSVRGMEGMNFGRVMRGIRADLPVVLLAVPGDQVEKALERGMVALLMPVSLDTMESVVMEMLAPRPAAKKPT